GAPQILGKLGDIPQVGTDCILRGVLYLRQISAIMGDIVHMQFLLPLKLTQICGLKPPPAARGSKTAPPPCPPAESLHRRRPAATRPDRRRPARRGVPSQRTPPPAPRNFPMREPPAEN